MPPYSVSCGFIYIPHDLCSLKQRTYFDFHFPRVLEKLLN